MSLLIVSSFLISFLSLFNFSMESLFNGELGYILIENDKNIRVKKYIIKSNLVIFSFSKVVNLFWSNKRMSCFSKNNVFCLSLFFKDSK